MAFLLPDGQFHHDSEEILGMHETIGSMNLVISELGIVIQHLSHNPDPLGFQVLDALIQIIHHKRDTHQAFPIFLYKVGNIPIFISAASTGVDADGNVIDKVSLGRGLATTPNLHVGKQEGVKAFVQTSTGTIVEIPQPNLPIPNAKTGKASWGEIK